MRTTEVYVEAKKSKNYQTYTVAETIMLEEGDDRELAIQGAQARCRARVEEQLELDKQKLY